jgi:site-specific DNA recombinase
MVSNVAKDRCATYIRVSTDDQADNYSLPSQTRGLRERAESRSFDIIAECIDDGYTGEDFDRPGITKIRELAAAKLIDVVLIYDP